MGDHDDGCCDACRQFGDREPVKTAARPALCARPDRVKIIVQEKGGATLEYSPTKSEVQIGRVRGNDIVLPKGNVDKRAASIVFKDDKAILVDSRSSCGTYLNGRKITSPVVIPEGATIYIGDFVLRVVPT